MRNHAARIASPASTSAQSDTTPAVPAAPAVRQALQSRAFALPPAQQRAQQAALSGVAAAPALPVADLSLHGDASERQAQASARATRASPGSAPAQAEPRGGRGDGTGLDFSRVRVHAGTEAAASAARLGARAFTYGDHIVFGEGEFAPESERGHALLSHELAHVAQQQAGGRPFLARDPLETYRTNPIDFDRADIEKNAGASYWEQKVMQSFALVNVNGALNRGAEERDAVLSLAWKSKPSLPLKGPVEQIVAVPVRKAAKGSKAVVFRFAYKPVKGGPPEMSVSLVSEEGAAAISAATDPPAGPPPPSPGASNSRFPGGMDSYWAAYPDERKQIDHWMTKAPKKFDQIVTTKASVKGKPHQSAIRLTGEKDAQGKVNNLTMVFVSETAPVPEDPPAGYDSKDFQDLQLDADRAKATGALGAIKGLETLPADERLSVKFAVHQYFAKGTSSAEVDIALPIANTQKTVQYTLRFRKPGNDVEVERLGDPAAAKSYALDPNALNVGRAHGFAAASGNETTLKAWLGKRYPAIKVQANNVAGILSEANKAIEAGAGTPAWYASNYKLDVLDATAGEKRLLAAHASQINAAQTADMKTFTSSDLHRIEYAMEPMQQSILDHLQGVKLVRQRVALDLVRVGKRQVVREDPKTAGLTWQNGSERTVGIFDNAFNNDALLFAGGSRGVRPASTMTFSHEFGHAIEKKSGIEAAFKKFVGDKKIKQMTWYAVSKPATETFPEAFAIYQNDPEWMQTNLPELYAWFETLNATGAPP